LTRHDRLTQQIDPEVFRLKHKLIVNPLLAMIIILPRDRIVHPAKSTAAQSGSSNAQPQSHPPQTLPPVPAESYFQSFQRNFTPFRFQHLPQNPVRIPRRVE